MDNSNLIKDKKSFTASESALACVLFIVLNFIFIQVYSGIPDAMKTEPFVYIAQFLVEALFAIAAIIVAKSKKIDLWTEAGFKNKINYKIVLIGLAIAVASLLFFSMLTYAFVDFLGYFGYKSSASSIVIDNFGAYIVYLVVICASPAIFEEMLFRGVIASGFKKYGKIVAIAISSVIFMLMHGSPDQTVHQFIVGAVLGYVFVYSGNIWLGTIIHFFNNAISVTQLYIITMINPKLVSGAETVTETITLSNCFIELIIGIALALVGYLVIKYLVQLMLKENETLNGKAQTINIAESLEMVNENSGEVVADSQTSLIAQNNDNQSSSNNSENTFALKVEDGYYISQDETEEETNSEGQTLEENTSEETLAEASVTNKNEMSLGTVIMFTLSGVYMLFMWLMTLISGF